MKFERSLTSYLFLMVLKAIVNFTSPLPPSVGSMGRRFELSTTKKSLNTIGASINKPGQPLLTERFGETLRKINSS